MKWDVYTINEIAGLECEWDPTPKVSDAILGEINVSHEDFEAEWECGSLTRSWKAPLIQEDVLYPPGTMILFDGYEVYYIQREE